MAVIPQGNNMLLCMIPKQTLKEKKTPTHPQNQKLNTASLVACD